MKFIGQRSLAIAMAALAAAILVGIRTNPPLFRSVFGSHHVLAITISGVLFTAAFLLLLTSLDRRRGSARIRLDWFVPALRRRTADQRVSHSFPGRALRNVLPASWQSNHLTKRRGPIRRALRWMGLSWLASPMRRAVQAACLLLFAMLFFWVCWPYGARPATPGSTLAGWRFDGLDQATGEITLRKDAAMLDHSHDWKPAVGDSLFLYCDASAMRDVSPTSARLGRFVVTQLDDTAISLAARESLMPEAFDALLAPSQRFTLRERDDLAWPSHYADNLAKKELVAAEVFLVIDPLVSLSTAIASRSLVWSLGSAAAILIVCVLIPRGFCGYLCPLGTTIDLFDWAIGRRVTRFRVPDDGWWVHVKYYLLAGTLVAALCGVLVSGFFSAIPVITRAMLFLFEPIQSGALRGWHLVPSPGLGQWISILLFLAVLSLGFLRPRFWCKYVCPSGALFSLGNLFRVSERKVESSCIHCNKCVEICPFDAIKPDFTTRTTDCTMCQSCGGVCPTHAIKFVERWNVVELKVEDEPPTHETAIGRRGFFSLATGSTAAVLGGIGVAGVTKTFGANLSDPTSVRPVRPPGSVPEQEFLEMCIRCGECFKACPNNVLQPEGFEQGLEGLWTPLVNADWAGCESSCNACGQVCPTGAIRALPLEEKKVARMGLAIVNESTCLPFAGREACDLCVQECDAAGYHAIEYTQVGVTVDESGQPVAGSGYLAPVVLDDLCVGCGLCQTRCVAINVKDKRLLLESAIVVEAGEGKEDRLMKGSYLTLRESRRQEKNPAFEPNPTTPPDGGDPFGLDATKFKPEDANANPFGSDVDAKLPNPENDDPFGIR